ncbi:hypothetical protein HJC23_004985 [Cyclotella cryptica]|uniref:Calcineurin-like phosphoesterase domain-containing protein n=1 Tax=Cyclotella cryptica TaxID=29204 RepID=A0ABD3P756_9STRA|eukprot:CCRYP_017093-RA/>CCRYP_017093-RA protein AED:0.11 eAED:0.11 QI:0/-1/0/1/-1/1/1/0/837
MLLVSLCGLILPVSSWALVVHASHQSQLPIGQISKLRAPTFQRRAQNADNDSLPTIEDALAEDGLVLPAVGEDATSANATNTSSTDEVMLASTNATNATESPSTGQLPSNFPSTTFIPTQHKQDFNTTSITSTPSISPSNSIKISTASPTGSPVHSTSQPTYGTLPIQPVNIMVLTDVHSWVQGHKMHEPALNADYGDVLSFYQQFKAQVASTTLEDGSTPDLYFVMNGDFVHGTILGDDPPTSLSGIIERMPYDVVTVGNHDVSNLETVEELRRPGGLVDVWGERLVTSNVRVMYSSNKVTEVAGYDGVSGRDGTNATELVPLGNNYRFLHGNQGTILTLGFLYNMKEDEAAITVETVEDVMQQSWFTSLFAMPRTEDFDAVLVLAHMDVKHELVTLLYETLRKLVGESMVIQFITGHTHIRDYIALDDYSSSFEAGRYLDTIGFVSFDLKNGSFQHIFVNANKASIAQSLGMGETEYLTQEGKELSEYINRTFQHAGANEIVGCSPRRYRVDGYLNETDSLLRLYLEEVMPTSFLQHYNSGGYSQYENVFLQRLDWFVRYDLFPGVVTINDIVGVIPDDDTIVSVSHSVRGRDILDVMVAWNNGEVFLDNVTKIVGISTPNSAGVQNSQYALDNNTKYSLYTLSKFAPSLNKIMNDLNVAPFTLSSHAVYNGDKTVRSMWTDYIKRSWPYDGNDCECVKDSICHNYTNSSYYNRSDSWPREKTSSSPIAHGNQHVSFPINSNPSVPESNEHYQSSGDQIPKNNANHNTRGKFLVIAVSLASVFYTLRMRQQGYSAASDATMNNDLELTVTPPPGYGNMTPGSGYSSPQLASGRYV